MTTKTKTNTAKAVSKTTVSKASAAALKAWVTRRLSMASEVVKATVPVKTGPKKAATKSPAAKALVSKKQVKMASNAILSQLAA